MLDGVKIDQLRMFIACADAGSFSAAARELRRAQSAVSQAIQSLEEILGVTLFDRTQRPPSLTEAGKVLLLDARQVARNVDTLRARASSISATAEPEIALSIEQVFPNRLLMQTLIEMRETFPHVAINVFNEGVGEPARSVHQGNAKLAIWSPANDSPPGLETEFLGFVGVAAVAAASHPLAAIQGPIDQSVLDEHVQLSLTDRKRGYKIMVLSRRGWNFVDQNSRLEFVLAGFGWALMPLHYAEKHLQSGDLVRLDLAAFKGRPILYPLYTAHRTDSPPGPATRWLLDNLRRRFAEWAQDSGFGNITEGVQLRVTTA